MGILGLLIGSIIGGRIGDQIGRKKASFFSYLVIIPSVIGAGFVNSYAAYAILHFIYSSTLPIVWINVTVYFTEIFQPNWRYAFTAAIIFQVGGWTLTLIAYLCSTWTMVHVCIGLVCVLVLPIYFLVPESPRWLAQNGQEDDAFQVMLDTAKTNQREINDNDKKEIQAIINDIGMESKATENQLSPLDIFKHGQMTKVVVLSLAWICVCVSYYALGLNSSNLSGDIYINFFLYRTVAMLQIPIIIAPSFFFGLRISFFVLQVVLGISCIILAFIPRDQTTAVLVVYLFSTLMAGTSFSYAYYYTAELYPTNLRSQAVGFQSMVARIFCLLAPFLGDLATYWQPLPMVLVGIPIIISGFLILLLPNTHKKELPNTIENTIELQDN